MSRLPLTLRNAVFAALNTPQRHHWTVQGFGMLRTYLDADKRYRLNIWHDALSVPGVSTIHDHPWHFTSWVIAGAFMNRRYAVIQPTGQQWPPTHSVQTIRTGEGGGPIGEPAHVILAVASRELYSPGDTYSQHRDEVHESAYQNGCVTLNDRTERNGENARVFWPYGEKWVDAEPREATRDEAWLAISAARMRLANAMQVLNLS